MKNLINIFLKNTVWIYGVIKYIFPISYLVLLLVPYNLPIWILIYPVLAFVLMVLYKDYGSNQVLDFNIFRGGILLYAFVPFRALNSHLEGLLGKKLPAFIEVMFSVVVFILVLYLFFVENEKKKEFISNIKVKEFLSGTSKGNNYDVVLCIDKETGSKVVWKGDDRFTHAQVVGPTGCGKTSQALLPIIEQDIRNRMVNKLGVTVVEPKGDFAEQVYALAKYYGQEKDALFFNPVHPDCPKFNVLDGKEDEVIETLSTVFEMLTPDSSTYFKDIANNLIRKSVMVLKRLEQVYTDDTTNISSRPATLIALSDLVHNTNGLGKKWINELVKIPTLTPEEKKQNEDTRDWFLNEYFNDRSKVYENTNGIRTQISKLIQNKYLRKVLNPENGKSEIDFDKHFEKGGIISITTAQGTLRELGSYLGYFLIFTMQSSIFRRKGNEFTRIPNFLFIDEFQKYANSGFSDIFTEGRSYKVSALIASQARGEFAMGSGREAKAFLDVVDANCRNIIVFGGISADDAKHYSATFGDVDKIKERTSVSKSKAIFGYGNNVKAPTESISNEVRAEAEFPPTELIYQNFGEFTYRLIVDKCVTRARKGCASWIDRDLKSKIDAIVQSYNQEQERKLQVEDDIINSSRRKLYSDFRNSKGIKSSTPTPSTPQFQEGIFGEQIIDGEDDSVGEFNPARME